MDLRRKQGVRIRKSEIPNLVSYPGRVWEPGWRGGWVSRVVTEEDRENRRKLTGLLGAVDVTGSRGFVVDST